MTWCAWRTPTDALEPRSPEDDPQVFPARAAAILRVGSPMGQLDLAATPDGLCGIDFADESLAPNAAAALADPHAEIWVHQAAEQIAAYFRGDRTVFDVKLDLRGTTFRRRVWTALLDIPFGQIETYAAIAKRIGKPGGSRAVGAAAGENPILILVPCHRLVASNGKLGGFSAGLPRKRSLLMHEGHVLPAAAASE